jgi:signal transduction histidine kinase
MDQRLKNTIFEKPVNFVNKHSMGFSLGSIIGLTVCYILCYPILTATFGVVAVHFIVIPVLLSGWFYGIRGGLIASLFGVFLNMILSRPGLGWNGWNNWVGNYAVGAVALVVVGLSIGFLQENIKTYTQMERDIRLREKRLALLNEITQTILVNQDLSSTLQILIKTITKLFDADECYITRWDMIQERVISMVMSDELERLYLSRPFDVDEKNITKSVLDEEQVLFTNDVFDASMGLNVTRMFPFVSVLGIPLIVSQHKLGAVIIAYNTPHKFIPEEIELAEQAGAQIALALWNNEQEEKIGYQLKETNTLVTIGRALSKTERTGTNTVLQLIVDSARELIPRAEQSVIHLLDKEENILISYAASGFFDNQQGKPRIKMPLGAGVAGQVIQQGDAINIPDVLNDSRFLINDPPPFRSLLVAPIQSGQEQIGTISVQSNSIHAFSTQEVELLKALGAQAAIAIENTQLYEMTEKRLKEMDVLYQISRDMGISFNPNDLFEEVIELLQNNFDYYKVQIFLLSSFDGKMIDFYTSDRNQKIEKTPLELDADSSIVGHVSHTGEAFITNNVEQVPFFKRDISMPDVQSELAVPIKVEDQVIGVLDVQHAPPHKLRESDLRLLTAIANQLSTSLHEANLYTNLQESLKQEQAMRSQLVQSERLAVVGRLLASVSHELNNPLQAIQNALFLIKDEIGLSNQGRQDMDIILSETERMATLIERLRLVYKPLREKDFQLLQINSLVEDIYTLISAHMRRKEINFKFDPDPNLTLISGIPDQLIQVLLNLFLNAVEAMPTKGSLFVRTETMPAKNEIMITIKDTGPGIDPELLPNIFNPFVTNKDTGTGLGLAISHDIIEGHTGRIQANNDPNGGAIFTIWLPVEQKEYS